MPRPAEPRSPRKKLDVVEPSATGRESRSVEAQIYMADGRSAIVRAEVLSEESLDLLRKKESILMSRTRVVRDLQKVQNPRYRAVLSKALADLDAQLSNVTADALAAGETVVPDVGTTAHAIAVFGDRAKALDWLKTPTHLFAGKSPEEYARSGGADEVEKILTRIEYGVFS